MSVKKIILFFAAVILIVVIIFFVQSKKQTADTPSLSFTPEMQILPPQKGGPIIILETTYGTVKFKLYPQFAPENVKNFSELTKRGFYDGLIFHRVIKDFMIQGGDPRGDGTGGETYLGPGATLPDEISVLRHIRGAVSMANRGPNTATSQFFIVQAKEGTHWLNSRHTVFGQVFEGMDVVDRIALVEKDASDRPLSPVKIIKAITIIY